MVFESGTVSPLLFFLFFSESPYDWEVFWVGNLTYRVKPKVEQTAAEKRRAAIMAALEPNTIAGPSNPSKPIVKAKSINMTSMMVGGQRVAVPRKEREVETKVLVVSDSEDEEVKALPSMPKDVPSRKRQLPWEENVG